MAFGHRGERRCGAGERRGYHRPGRALGTPVAVLLAASAACCSLPWRLRRAAAPRRAAEAADRARRAAAAADRRRARRPRPPTAIASPTARRKATLKKLSGFRRVQLQGRPGQRRRHSRRRPLHPVAPARGLLDAAAQPRVVGRVAPALRRPARDLRAAARSSGSSTPARAGRSSGWVPSARPTPCGWSRRATSDLRRAARRGARPGDPARRGHRLRVPLPLRRRPPAVGQRAGAGHGLSALSRGAVRLKDTKYFDAARSALGIFKTAPPAGVLRQDAPPAPTTCSTPTRRSCTSPTASRRRSTAFMTSRRSPTTQRAVRSSAPARRSCASSCRASTPARGRSIPGRGPSPTSATTRSCATSCAGSATGSPTDQARAAAPAASSSSTAPPSTGGTPAGTIATAPAPDPALYCDTAQRFTADLTTKPALNIAPPTTLRAKARGHGAASRSRRSRP